MARIIVIIALTGICILSRLMDHPWNFTPVMAAVLFSGFYLKDVRMALIPLALYFITDLVVGFHAYQALSIVSVYGSYALIYLLGAKTMKSNKPQSILLFSFSASMLFFVITNLASWYVLPEYTKDLSGLVFSFEQAIPFYRGALIGDLVYSLVIFGIFHLVEKYVLKGKENMA